MTRQREEKTENPLFDYACFYDRNDSSARPQPGEIGSARGEPSAKHLKISSRGWKIQVQHVFLPPRGSYNRSFGSRTKFRDLDFLHP